MNEIQIKLADIKDIYSIVSFQQKMAVETEGKELNFDTIFNGVKSVFENDTKGFYLVASDQDFIAASLMITREWSDWRNGYFWWIQSVYVLPEYRRKGIYRRMYSFICDMAVKKPGVCGIRLYVEEENENAKKTYQSLGMIKTHYHLYEFEF